MNWNEVISNKFGSKYDAYSGEFYDSSGNVHYIIKHTSRDRYIIKKNVISNGLHGTLTALDGPLIKVIDYLARLK